MLKVIGIVVLVWLGFIVLGALFDFLAWAIPIGIVVLLGVLAYGAIKSRSEPPAIR